MRPQFHFTAPTGWINDPHGFTFRDGEYHAFYQYVPDSLEWAMGCHWGHASGRDLLSLTAEPIALAPGDGDEGIWTGALVTHNRGDRIFYTAVSQPDPGIGRVRVATALDADWTSWQKGAVVAEAPDSLAVVAFRDPFVVAEPDGTWRMFVGASLATGAAAALAYHSADLDSWEFEGVALERSSAEREPVWTGALWECPQIFALDDRHILVSSVWEADVLHYAVYAVGDYRDGRFTAEHWGRLTYGPSYYAPSFFRDSVGDACVTFWMRGVRDAVEGWSGAHSLPYRLALQGNTVVATPHPDVAAYRRRTELVDEVEGLAADAEWRPGRHLRIISGDHEVAHLGIEGSSITLSVEGESWSMAQSGGPVRIIIDGPTLEVSTLGGLMGAAIAPAGSSLRFEVDDASAVEVWALGP